MPRTANFGGKFKVVDGDVARFKRLEIVDDHFHTRIFADVIEGESVFVLTNHNDLRSIELRSGKNGSLISLIKDGYPVRLQVELDKNVILVSRFSRLAVTKRLKLPLTQRTTS